MVEPAELDDFPHYPVLYKEIIHALQPKPGGTYLDGTVGAGGHAWGILDASSPDGCLLGLDLDPQAIEIASRRLITFGHRAEIIQASYTELDEQLERHGWQAVDGLLLDLGLSSMQIDSPDRGFSFDKDAPLDMRFDPENPTRADVLLNDLSEEDLTAMLFEYGEESLARPIARAIVRARPVVTTRQLAAIVSQVVFDYRPARNRTSKSGRRHPATRTFQALRIAVNKELANLEAVLPKAVKALKPGGRMAIISFHSLEDRIVKQFFRRESRDCICPPRQPACTCSHIASIVEINKRPVVPEADEVRRNPRSRSARLRVAQRKI